MSEVQLHEGQVKLDGYYRNQILLTANLFMGADDLGRMILDLDSESQFYLIAELAGNPAFVTRLLQHLSDEELAKIIRGLGPKGESALRSLSITST